MARRFRLANTEYLVSASSPLSDLPCTFACWFYSLGNITANQSLIALGKSSSSRECLMLQLRGAVATDPIGVVAVDTVGTQNANGTTYPVGTWAHGAGVFATTASRTVYLNGANVGTDTTAETGTISGLDRIAVGAMVRDAVNNPSDAIIADAAIWNVALTDSELAKVYATGPLSVRSQSLVFYAPLPGRFPIEVDLMRGLNLANVGSVYADHPPHLVQMRRRIRARRAVVAAARVRPYRLMTLGVH